MEREKDWLSKYVDKDELEDFTSQGMQRNGQRLVRERSMSAVHPDANMEIGEEGLTLDSMLFNCFENASLLNKKLPSPLAFKDPLLERFYFESRTSLLLGLETASIVLASCLVEYLLKRACFICRHGKFPSLETLLIWQEEKERKETFDGAINGAYELGLITAEKRDILKEFKDLIRNPYMHSNLFQLTKSSSTTAGIFELPKDATEGAKKFVAEFEASPIWRGLSRNMDSTELAYPLFCFVHDQIVQIREAVTKIID